MAKLVIPHIFTPGTPAQASQMNANFDAISNWSLSGQIETDSIKFPLESRSNDNQNNTRPILKFVQTIDEKILELQNAEGSSSIYISQTEELNASTGIIHINDQIAQTQAASAAIKLVLSSVATSPAILVSHGTETLNLTKSEFKILDNTFKVNSTQMLIPRVAGGSRPANAEEGSLLYNSTTKQLNEKKAASGGWAPVGAPVGSIMMFVGATAPEGWLLCNGDTVPNTVGTVQGKNADFSSLYAVLNAQYGVPKVAGKLPDLRGAFVRGTGTNAHSPGSPGVAQTGPALGDWQDDSTAANGLTGISGTQINTNNTSPKSLDHTHNVVRDSGGNVTAGGEQFKWSNDNDQDNSYAPTTGANSSLDHRHQVTISGDSETRPFSIGLNYIIKY